MNPNTDIGIFVNPFGDGGNERNMINLAGEFARRGLVVDLVVDRLKGPLGKLISPDVRVVELKTGQSAETVKALVNYFNHSRPEIFHTVKGFGREALHARKACGNKPRLSLMVGTTTSQKVKFMNPFKRLMTIREMRKICPKIDLIIAVSKGVAKDVAELTGLPLDRISVVPLPVITREFFRLSAEPIDHAWLADKVTPVMVGAGRLGRAKDFSTLLRAFAIVRQQRPVKLLILGAGRKRDELERLAHKLNIRDDVHLPGFVINPYAYLSRADLFVLSSLWEGMPNVLIEALALGIPVASTDCHSGPREILQDGLLGHLVPIGDHNALAQAISITLDRPIEANVLKLAAAAYTAESSAEQHLQIFNIKNTEDPHRHHTGGRLP